MRTCCISIFLRIFIVGLMADLDFRPDDVVRFLPDLRDCVSVYARDCVEAGCADDCDGVRVEEAVARHDGSDRRRKGRSMPRKKRAT